MDSLKRGYILVYNLVQLIGNLCVIASITRFIIDNRGVTDSYHLGAPIIQVLLGLQWLEIIHTLVGLAKGSPVTSFMQVFGKSIVFFVFLNSKDVPSEVTSSWTSGILLLAWSWGDSLRFLFYLQNQLGFNLRLIVWLRYSGWIILYPVGILAEGVTLLLNIYSLKKTERLSYSLPNQLNISFDPVSAIYVYVCLILPLGGFKMLSYMWSQRIKALSGQSIKKD